MPFTQILEQIGQNNSLLDQVSNRLDLLRELYPLAEKDGIVPTNDGFVYCKTVTAKTVYQDSDIVIMMWKMAQAGQGFSNHEHIDSAEFAVVATGSVEITVAGVPRVFNKMEHVLIPVGVSHTCKALMDGSSVVGIYVPPEKAYIVESLCQKYRASS